MANPYQGLASNVDNFLFNTISGATSTSPIQITTPGPHYFSTGDQVAIFGVLGNTAANSPQNLPWTVTVTGQYTFTLNGSDGNGSYTGGGQCMDLSLTPFSSTMSGADSPLVANVGIQSALDRTQFLARQQPLLYVVNQYCVQFAHSGTGAGLTLSTTGDYESMISTLFTTGSSPTSFSSSASSFERYVWSVGDVFDVSFTGAINFTVAGVTPDAWRAALSWQDDSHALASSAAAKFVGGDVEYQPPGAGPGLSGILPVSLRGLVTNANGGATATISAFGSNLLTVTGLTNMTSANVGNWLRLAGCANAGNNGLFLITAVSGGTTVQVLNFNGSYPDANSGSISWGLYGSKFNFGIDISGTAGDSFAPQNSHLCIVNHYRPTVDPLNPVTGF
jgi:hypothetical protein